jgi:hypothetical protein
MPGTRIIIGLRACIRGTRDIMEAASTIHGQTSGIVHILAQDGILRFPLAVGMPGTMVTEARGQCLMVTGMVAMATDTVTLTIHIGIIHILTGAAGIPNTLW